MGTRHSWMKSKGCHCNVRKRRQKGEMNGLEKCYAAHLDVLKAVGTIKAWYFEAVKFRIGNKCFLTPDFLVIFPDGSVEVHEVKGFWEDDARVKMRAVTDMYRDWTFVGVTKRKGVWYHEEFTPSDGPEVVCLNPEVKQSLDRLCTLYSR